MPRPPRARTHGPTRPAKPTNPIIATEPTQEPPQASGTSSDIYDVSDREKERAAARRRSLRDSSAGRNRNSSAGTSQATTMEQKTTLDRANKRRDSAMERLQNITSTEDEEVVNDSDGASDGGVEEQHVVKSTPLRGRLVDPSGLDLDDSMFNDLNTTFDTVGHASAQRSAETSSLSATHFRRRPRAGSFLSRDDGPIRPSSRAGLTTPAFSSTLNFGVFKRRAREPSILSTAQKPRPQRPEPEHELEVGNDDDDNDEEEEEEEEEEVELDGENGFAPEDESTPLRRSNRVSGEAAESAHRSSATSRKRKSTESHEQRVRSSPFEIDDGVRNSIEQSDSHEQSPASSPPSLPREMPSSPAVPPMDSELMAPPLSSGSSENNEEVWPPLKSIPKTRTRGQALALRQTPGHDDNVSDMSSPPSLTHSPNYAHSSSPPPARAVKPTRKAAIKPPPKLTTADLTGLLPRRRHRGTDDDPFGIGEDESDAEVDISGLGRDEDELAHLDVRARRRPAPRAGAKNQSTAVTRARPSNRNTKDKPTQASTNKRISRTYGRLSDKENQGEDEEVEEDADANENAVADDVEEDSQMLEARVGAELKNAVRKFQEVDKWELSFEENLRSSSPLDAR